MNDVLVVGGGLAGLAAGSALARSGAKVTLLERKPFVGGRAYSYVHPALSEEIDCQHVLLGCCTNLRHLCEQAGIADRIRWYDELTFLEPNAPTSTRLRTSRLPAPFHSSLDFARAPMLGVQDKAAIARGLLSFANGYPQDDSESFARWLKRTGQTERAIHHLWEPVIVGALNDSFDNCSTKYAGQVFYESFLKSAEGGRLGSPTEPLSRFYSAIAKDIALHGGGVRMESSVVSISRAEDGQWLVRTAESEFTAPNVLLALPFQQVDALLPHLPGAAEFRERFRHFRNAPITTVHFWFDRDISDLDHAVLLDTGIQWMFHKSRIRRAAKVKGEAPGSYVELTISASFAQLRQSREEIFRSALEELAIFFPKVRSAVVQKSAILKEARATFSVTPGLDRFRPAQATPWPGLFVAGDWTSTGWPSTMEGAVRSGYLAAEAIARSAGTASQFLRPDLPAAGFMKLFA